MSQFLLMNPKRFTQQVKYLRGLFKTYIFRDLWLTLLVSDLWLPNISSPVKHQLFFGILLSIAPEDFSKARKQIKTYGDFSILLGEILKHAPSFPALEDYVPEPDWGDVKYVFERERFRIFYGCELENIYDHLTLFEQIYCGFDAEYKKTVGRSPVAEFRDCLSLQEHLIENLSLGDYDLEQIKPGHLEIPPVHFWDSVRSYVQSYPVVRKCSEEFLQKHSAKPGSISTKALEIEPFCEAISVGRFIGEMFIEDGADYLLMPPRRLFPLLIESWTREYATHGYKFTADGMRYSMRITEQLLCFLRERIPPKALFPIVNAFNEDGSHHPTLFTAAIFSRDTVFLVYLTNPAKDSREVALELEEITPEVDEALRLISTAPVSFNLNLEKKRLEFRPKNSGRVLRVVPLIVVPQIEMELAFSAKTDLVSHVIFLDQFLALIDEIDHVDELDEFFEFFNDSRHQQMNPLMTSILDFFSIFRSFHASIERGATRFDKIMIDPHSGTGMRYEHLREFWRAFPEARFFNHPRSWKIRENKEKRVRLIARGMLGSALVCRVNKTELFVTAPFHRMSYEQGKVTDLIAQVIQDVAYTRETTLGKHPFFEEYPEAMINIFPNSVVKDSTDFQYLQHLSPTKCRWVADHGFVEAGVPQVRLVYNDELVQEAFVNAQDSSVEVDLCLLVLKEISKITPAEGIKELEAEIDGERSQRPRFRLFEFKQPAAVPELLSSIEIKPSDYKAARKRIAEIAKAIGVQPGQYSGEGAKNTLNILRDGVLCELNERCASVELKSSIVKLIEEIEAVVYEDFKSRQTAKAAQTHEVDYDIAAMRAKQYSSIMSAHWNLRFLIEKVWQLQSEESRLLDDAEYRVLFGMVDWLHSLYSASDHIHYGIEPVSIVLDEEYVLEIVHSEEWQRRDRQFGEEEQSLDQGLTGNPTDALDHGTDETDFVKELNLAFQLDLGFTFSAFVNLLTLLARWPDHCRDASVSPYYQSSVSEILSVAREVIPDFEEAELRSLFDFLTLKTEELLKVVGDNEAKDLPVWEYRKRPMRYNLRPLISNEGMLIWGPYSCLKSRDIWAGSLRRGMLPADLDAPNIEGVLASKKKGLDTLLEQRTAEVVSRVTPYVRTNLEADKIDKEKGEVGEFDVLAFLPEKNIVINCEAKNLSEFFCAKDARRIRNRIFGEGPVDRGYVGRIEKRHEFIQVEWSKVLACLDWPVPKTAPQVISLYVAQRAYWWTRFPVRETPVRFTRIELLENELGNL